MKTTTALIALALVTACSHRPPNSPPAPVEPGFEPVAFLVGDWEGRTQDGVFDEHWIEPRGGMMLGVGRELDGTNAASFFELLRIERRPAGLVLVPQPGGGPGHEFTLREATPGAFVFENAGDDHVSKIGYRLDGDRLTAKVEFRADGRIETFVLRRTRGPR